MATPMGRDIALLEQTLALMAPPKNMVDMLNEALGGLREFTHAGVAAHALRGMDFRSVVHSFADDFAKLGESHQEWLASSGVAMAYIPSPKFARLG